MKKKSYFLLFVSSLVCLASNAFAKSAADTNKIENLWVSPSPTGLYLVEQMTQDKQQMLRIGFNHGPEQIFWDSVSGKAKSVTSLGDVLYVAFDDGTILQPNGHILGKLPNSAIPERLIADQNQNRLFVLARQADIPPATTRSSTGPATKPMPASILQWHLYELVSGKWLSFTGLPGKISPSVTPAVLVDNGRLDLFAFPDNRNETDIIHWSFHEGKWADQPVIKSKQKIKDLYPLALNGIIGLVLSVSTEQGDQLMLCSLEKPEKFKTLEIDRNKLVLKTEYALAAETDRVLVAFLTEDQKQIKLARWSVSGEPVGKTQSLNQLFTSEKQDSSIFFALLLVAIILTVFLGRTKTIFAGDTMPPGMTLPAYWRRGLAFAIDMLLISFVFLFILWLYWPDQYIALVEEQRMMMKKLFDPDQVSSRMYIIGILNNSIYAVYCMVMEGIMGWTVGKWMFGLEVRQAGKLTDRPTLLKIFIRNIVKILELYLLPLLFVMLLTRSRQRMGDLLAGTVVLQQMQVPQMPE
jgi:uncharacterized RDD family membrane protein YckC